MSNIKIRNQPLMMNRRKGIPNSDHCHKLQGFAKETYAHVRSGSYIFGRNTGTEDISESIFSDFVTIVPCLFSC